jgi:hypothetical protein
MKSKLTPIQIAIILLALATAAIHAILSSTAGTLFLLNALGYLTFLGLFFLPVSLFQRYHKLVRWGFIAFALVTILAWVLKGDPGNPVGWITKAIEVALVVLLFLDGRQES